MRINIFLAFFGFFIIFLLQISQGPIILAQGINGTDVTTTLKLSVGVDNLIKGSFGTVYYYAADGFRYVFPNASVFGSWFTDYSKIIAIPDDELALIPLKGNITYRPGIRMIKIQTSPKVYVIERGGIARWVQTEELAQDLYGSDWNKKIDDVPDVFFENYKVGNEITTSTIYKPDAVVKEVKTINEDKGIVMSGSPLISNTIVGASTIPTSPILLGSKEEYISKNTPQGLGVSPQSSTSVTSSIPTISSTSSIFVNLPSNSSSTHASTSTIPTTFTPVFQQPATTITPNASGGAATSTPGTSIVVPPATSTTSSTPVITVPESTPSSTTATSTTSNNPASTTTDTVSVTSTPQTIPPPLIIDVSIAVGSTTTTISWTTDSITTGKVNYGTSSNLSNSKSSSGFWHNSTVFLTDLSPETTYYYNVEVTNTDGKTTTRETTSFTTTAVPQIPSSPTAYGTVTFTPKGDPRIERDRATIEWYTSIAVLGSNIYYSTQSPVLNGSYVMNTSYGWNLQHGYVIGFLVPNTKYYYFFEATDSGGLVSKSQEYSLTTLP